jgi:uncharacterized protein
MKPRTLLLLSLLLLPAARLAAQQNPDPKQESLGLWARLKTMNQAQFADLLAKAQAGDPAAQYQTGCAYNMGTPVPKNPDEAARWWLKSAEQGYALAEAAYGMWSRSSNTAVAERWMLLAAEHGDADTQLWLGVAYEDNWFGTTDDVLALKWFRKAAESGDPDAQVVLGQKYADGEGVEQSYELAAEWFRRAAEHFPDLGGAGQGRNQLAQLYMEGLGVSRDYAQAYFWFSLDARDLPAASAKSHLSAEQIKTTDASLAQWKEHHRLSPEVAAALNIQN